MAIPWGHHVVLMEKIKDLVHGFSQLVLSIFHHQVKEPFLFDFPLADFILLFIAQGTGIVLSFPNKTQIPGSTFKDWTNAERDSEYFHGEITLIQE